MARQRRRIMRSVDVYPLMETAQVLEFVAGCQNVAELYTVTLARTDQPIKATVSWTRIFVDARVRPGAPSRIEEEPPDGYGFSDGMRCAIDPLVLTAPASQRPRRYLDWLHQRMLELARERGWDETVLHQAFQDCLDADLTLVMTSKPRSSPDRKHRATVTLQLAADGASALVLMIEDRDGVERGRTTTAQGCSVDDFRRLARQLRWLDTNQVGADDDHTTLGPGLHRFTAEVGTFVDVDTARDSDRLLAFADQFNIVENDDGLTHEVDGPVAAFEGLYEPDVVPPRRLTLIGGGPVGSPWGIDILWSDAFEGLLGDLDGRPDWRVWWELAGQPECVMQYYPYKPATRVRIRRADRQVKVSFERPRETTDPIAEARADAEAVIGALTQRFGLPSAPPLY